MVNQFQHVTNYIADFEKAGLVYIQRRRRQGGRREQADAEKSLVCSSANNLQFRIYHAEPIPLVLLRFHNCSQRIILITREGSNVSSHHISTSAAPRPWPSTQRLLLQCNPPLCTIGNLTIYD